MVAEPDDPAIAGEGILLHIDKGVSLALDAWHPSVQTMLHSWCKL